MKLPKLTLIVPILLSLGTYSYAEDTAPSAPPAPPAGKPDRKGPQGGPGGPGARGAGRLSPEELKKFDKDGDGKLSDEEAAAAREARMKEREAEMKKFDKDGDGKLNDEERAAAFAARLESDPEMKKKVLEKFDEDKDGKLSDEELKKAAAARRGPPPGAPGEGQGPKVKEGEPRRVPKPKEAPKGAN